MKEENINRNNSDDVVFTYNKNKPNYNNIRFAFDRLIGPLATATVYEEYGDKRKEYAYALSVILRWSADYEKTKTLIYIQREELLSIYYKLEELNDELIYTSDSEMSDEIIIWLWNLMLLRKKQIEDWKKESHYNE